MSGRTALVTGGSEGIGRAIAVALVAAGHRVIFTGRRADVVARAAEDVSAEAMAFDITDEAAVAAAVADLSARGTTVDILVNNAGLVGNPGGIGADLLTRLRESFEANFFAQAHLSNLLIPGMMARGSGRVINVASTAGMFPPPLQIAYATSKAAVIALTRAMAVEVAAAGVTVNAVAPGAVATESYLARKGEAAMAGRARPIPSGRLSTPEDVAATVVYLASEAAGQVNGQVIALDGAEGVAGPYVTYWQAQRGG